MQFGGSNTHVQYNDGGPLTVTYAYDEFEAYNKATDKLII